MELPPFFKRGPSPLARLAFFSLLSLSLLVVDSRLHYLDVVRQAVAAATYPVQRLAIAPGEIFDNIAGFFVTQTALEGENIRLKQQRLLDAGRLQRQAALEAENAHLRRLLDARERFGGSAQAAQVLYAGRDPFTHKVIIDRGAQHEIKAGQAVVDEEGLVGQITRVYPWLSEVTLLIDKNQAVPIEVARSGLRGVVFGVGLDGTLELRYTPVNADVQIGDVLVTSGIDGAYPAGLPVATVSNIERNAAYVFAKITCTPLAGVNRHTQVLVLAYDPRIPEAPPASAEEATPRRKKGKKSG